MRHNKETDSHQDRSISGSTKNGDQLLVRTSLINKVTNPELQQVPLVNTIIIMISKICHSGSVALRLEYVVQHKN